MILLVICTCCHPPQTLKSTTKKLSSQSFLDPLTFLSSGIQTLFTPKKSFMTYCFMTSHDLPHSTVISYVMISLRWRSCYFVFIYSPYLLIQFFALNNHSGPDESIYIMVFKIWEQHEHEKLLTRERYFSLDSACLNMYLSRSWNCHCESNEFFSSLHFARLLTW